MPWIGSPNGLYVAPLETSQTRLIGHGVAASVFIGGATFVGGVVLGETALWLLAAFLWAAASTLLAHPTPGSQPRRPTASDEKRDRPYRELFDRVSAGLYRTTPSGRFLQANEAFRQMLAIPEGRDIRDVSVRELYIGFEGRGELLASVDAYDGMTTHEMPARRADGVRIWVRDRTRPVFGPDGSVVYYDGDLQDVTEQRRAEAELRSLVQSRSELIAAVSHELRTPLTAILGFLEVLASDGGATAAEQAELVQVALDQASDMALLIDDLLTSARIENDELVIAPEAVNILGAVEPIVSTIAPDAQIAAGSGMAETVWADPVRLRQILRNLMTNAVRHGSPPVTVSAHEVGRDRAQIIVTDRGPGVAVDAEQQIFDAFFRGSEARSRHGSIGLGLAVSRRLAKLMGGELFYVRCEGETRFVLELRACDASSEAA